MKKTIAIDGPSGAGKSTIARLLSNKIGFYYLDTGSLYRSLGVYLYEGGISESDDDDLISSRLQQLKMDYDGKGVIINGIDYSDKIRTPYAGHLASVFSAKKIIREYLLEYQREFGRNHNLVAEGRDMTTVVFPDAWRKFYIDASQKIRAERRYKQMIQLGKAITYEESLRDVITRDERDMNREIAPLRRAEDAIYIDTTNLSIDEVVERLMSLCREK